MYFSRLKMLIKTDLNSNIAAKVCKVVIKRTSDLTVNLLLVSFYQI